MSTSTSGSHKFSATLTKREETRTSKISGNSSNSTLLKTTPNSQWTVTTEDWWTELDTGNTFQLPKLSTLKTPADKLSKKLKKTEPRSSIMKMKTQNTLGTPQLRKSLMKLTSKPTVKRLTRLLLSSRTGRIWMRDFMMQRVEEPTWSMNSQKSPKLPWKFTTGTPEWESRQWNTTTKKKNGRQEPGGSEEKLLTMPELSSDRLAGGHSARNSS